MPAPQVSPQKERSMRRTDRRVHEKRIISGHGEDDHEFDQSVLELSRVTRVTKGGKRMRFRALVIVGDHRGRVGYGLAKGADVSLAINKAARQGRKHIISVPLAHETIPHRVRAKFGAAEVLLMPAPKGSGVIAGGPVRVVLGMVGVPNISSKMLGGKNKLNNTKATFAALSMLRVRTQQDERVTLLDKQAAP